MYEPVATLNNIDRNALPIVALCVIALIFNYAYFAEAIRLGERHRTFSVPVAATLVFVPHDFSYLIQYDKWFHGYDHWFPKLWWGGLLVTNSIEVVFFIQLLRFGRAELFPDLSKRQYVVVMLLALAGASVAWFSVKMALNDDLYLFSFGWTLFLGSPFCIGMMVRRGSGRGQSRWMWISYMLMAVFYWAATACMGSYFRSVEWLALLVIALGFAAANLWYLGRVPPYRP